MRSRLRRACAPCALVVLAAVAAFGCKSKEIGHGGTSGAPKPASANLIFEDAFEREELGEAWERGVGERGPGAWEIRDGWVSGQGLRNDPLWLKQPLPDDVRVEFDARALSPEGDLKVEIFGDGVNHASGYVLIFGGWKNSLDVIARLDEHGEDRKATKTRGVTPNVVYRMTIERVDGRLEWFVNGESFMTYVDKEPLRGQKHAHFAFSDWNAPVQFDNVAIYALE